MKRTDFKAIDLDEDKTKTKITSGDESTALSGSDLTKSYVSGANSGSSDANSLSDSAAKLAAKVLSDFLKNLSGSSASNRLANSNDSDLHRDSFDKFSDNSNTDNTESKNTDSMMNFLSGLSSDGNDSSLSDTISDFLSKLNSYDTSGVSTKALSGDLLNFLDNTSINVDDLLKYLNGLKDIEGDSWDESLYAELLKCLKGDGSTTAILGLTNLIASITSNVATDGFDMSKYGIIKTNFTIDWDKPTRNKIDLPDTDTYVGDIISYIEPTDTTAADTRHTIEKYLYTTNSDSMLTKNRKIGGRKVKIPNWGMSAEKKVRQYYMIKRKSTGNTTNWTGNDYTKHLITLLEPSDTSKSFKDADGFTKLGVSPYVLSKLLVQRFYVSGKKAPSKVTINKEVVSPIALTLTENKSKGALGVGIISAGKHDVIKVLHGILNRGGSANYQYVRPHIQMEYEVDSKLTKDTANASLTGLSSAMNATHTYNNYAIKCLVRSMPNFAPNMYFGVFSQYTFSKSGESEISDFIKISNTLKSTSIGSDLKGSVKDVMDNYFVRMTNVSIPGIGLDTDEYSFMGRKIPKIKSHYVEEHKTTLTFTLDQYGIILRQFNLLSGNFGSGEDDIGNSRIYSGFLGVDGSLYPNTFFPSTFFGGDSSTTNRRIDLSVIYNDFRTNTEFQNDTHKSSFSPAQKMIIDNDGLVKNYKENKVYGSYKSYRAYIFEDVKVLGGSRPLDFQRDSAGKMTIQVPIAFKRIKTIDANP